MSYARINMVEITSAENAKTFADDYTVNAAAEFPEAEILLSVTTGDASAVLTSVYPDKDAFDRSAAARAARGEANQDKIKGEIVVHEGEVTLSHTK